MFWHDICIDEGKDDDYEDARNEKDFFNSIGPAQTNPIRG
jgi:hypothetical protein